MEDTLLVFRCKRGSRNALARVYEKYRKDLLILAIALLDDTSSAEDVVHDVFLCFVQTVKKFKLTGSLKGYLLTCVANRARNRNKAKSAFGGPILTNSGLPAAPGDGQDEPSDSIVCTEELQQLRQAMAQLPYEQREVILLHLHSGMTFRTIARQQGISANTIKSRYRYGLDKLRLILDGEVKK